jgi:uncharacterized membrane protein YhiD involved in acid resistance
MGRDELVALFYRNLETVTVMQAASNMLTALLCTVFIYAVYFFTSKDVKPTAAFAKTILIVSLSVAMLVMMIGSNLALSLGMVGALSIIRFRAAVMDSWDAAFIFYAIAAGMASALGVHVFALTGTLFIAIAIIIFSFLDIGSRTYLFTVRTEGINSLVEKEIRNATGRRFAILTIAAKHDTENDSISVETVYEIGLKKDADALCKKLLDKDGVISVTAVLREEA